MPSLEPRPGRCGRRCNKPREDGVVVYCEQWPYKGSTSGACEKHGGKALKGAAHPNWKGGLKRKARVRPLSRYVPQNLREAYERALASPDLLSVRQDVALLDAKLEELLQRTDDGGDLGAVLLRAAEAWAVVRRGIRPESTADDVLAASQAAPVLTQLLGEGADKERVRRQAWEEARSILEQRRRAVETETKVAEKASGTMTQEQGAALVGLFLAALRESQVPRVYLVAVQDRLLKALGPGVEVQDGEA